MENSVKQSILARLFAFTFLLLTFSANAQYCDSVVPSFNVDLSASPNMNWVSSPIVRDGSCCGSVSPDVCLEFIITLHPSVIAVNFNIASGAVPPGALYYQIDCGPQIPVGDPICLSGPGPHHLTFCKPGNNQNTFSIETYSNPIIGPDITLNAGCQGFIYANYYNEPTVSWTSIAPGAQGDYDGLLSCTSGCDTTYLTAPVSAPPYVDYLVCGMDLPGCNPNPICDTVRVYFIEPVDVSISATTTTLCAGQTTTLTANASGGSGPYSYVWNNNSTSSSIITAGGTFYVDVVDTSGCYVASDTIVIQQFANPPVVAGVDQTACQGSSVTLTATGASTYSWDNGVTNGVPFGQPVGTMTYTVTGTDANGCTATDQVNVTVFPLPNINAGPDQTVCEGETVVLTGSGANSYVWNNGVNNGVSFQPALGTMTCTVIGTDMNGCSSTDDVNITVNPNPVVSAGPDLTVCEGSTVTLSGSGANSYSWTGGVSNGVAFIPPVGFNMYSVTGTNAFGCTNTDDVNIAVNANPQVSCGPDIEICEGESVVLSGSNAWNYTWTGGVVNNVPFYPSTGQYQYVVTGTDGNGCQGTDTINVLVNPNPVVYAGEDQELCEGELVVLFANGSPNLSWNNEVSNGVPFSQAIGTVTYTVFDTLATGCSGMDDVVVVMNPNPVVTAEGGEICFGEGITLNGDGAETYIWTGGVQNGEMFYPTETQSYVVTGFDANGCSSEFEVTVVVNDIPDVNFTLTNPDLSTTNPGTGFDNLSVGATQFEWDFGDYSGTSNEFEPYHEFPSEEGGGYYVILIGTSEFGCVGESTQYIPVAQDYSIFVPNAFTPDNNGVNEVFFPVLYGFEEDDFTMYIFDRWGELVFESHDMSEGWDGTYGRGNHQVQDGVFTWKIEARVKNSTERKAYTGHLTLIK